MKADFTARYEEILGVPEAPRIIGVCIFDVKESQVVELLPAQRDTRFSRQRGALTTRSIATHDAVIVVCDRDRGSAALDELPFAAALRRQYARAAERGSVDILSTRVTDEAIPFTVIFVKKNASAFERLSLAGRAWKELGATAPRSALLAASGLESAAADAMLEALVAAALAASAPLPNLKSKPRRPAPLEAITVLNATASLDLERSMAIHRGNHLARWLTTLPPNLLDSSSYRRALKTLAAKHRWSFRFLDEAALKRLGAGAFLAVARANEHREAGIVHLRYRAASGTKSPKLTLVGKGICFDTGGINLKPHKSMYHMHEDMQGSAVALGTLLALSEMRVPYDVDCWLAITENEIGARAYRPQEVVTASNGVTIQVAHSDAEGRMVLADTLALASREQPALMIDFATLTGSCIVALTERYSGAFTNRLELHPQIQAAGRASGERVWPFPMDEDFDADLDSAIADILQCTPDSKGDHILAARFLSRFVPASVPWIHLDLAASNRSGGLAHIPTEFTGFGVRYVTELLRTGDLLKPMRGKTGTAKPLVARRRRTAVQ